MFQHFRLLLATVLTGGGGTASEQVHSEDLTVISWDPRLQGVSDAGESFFHITHDAAAGSFWLIPSVYWILWALGFNEEEPTSITDNELSVCFLATFVLSC